ncbi:FAD-dependent oxidoreductase [Tsukamurella sp. PLM1]|uniref:FAD-dependent oxidoreductase n=1 Tax=Tsukamurella sp. PLM1 TaxID=2929795 RepID=UPI00206B5C42|nr:FAD-dependent oxidoreductase [Tsukamurella sp. PLM1]BDH59027.1 amino acid oxidase [Tsukamurella sp. PLM1]
MAEVTIVGAGVIGMSCAVRLLEAGHAVRVYGRELAPPAPGRAGPVGTVTSAVAAAVWYPYLAEPRDRVTGWSAAALAEFTRLAEAGVDGVVMTPGTEIFREPVDEPWWTSAVPSVQRVAEPRPGYAEGWSFVSPVIEMPLYLPWLAARVAELGGTVEQRDVGSLAELDGAVVNATGLGARELVGDASMEPVRGQVVYLEQVGVHRWWIDDSALDLGVTTYVVPRSRDVVVGGTEDHGAEELVADPATADAIVARARALVPELAGARVLGHNVGVRPARPTVRLERVGDVVHCYGHGGAGVTLSWGCADEVAALVG